MAESAFVKQSEQPLFPEILWNRPTMKRRAGRLLIVGGQKSSFSLAQAIYQSAEASGIGEALAIMPDTLRRVIGESQFARFAPASISGSLGKAALGEILSLAGDVDGLVVGADLTTNAETGIMIESLLTQLEQPIVITNEAIEILKFHPELITGNPKALVVVPMTDLFSLANHHHLPIAIKPHRGVIGKIEILRQLMDISRCSYVVFDQDILVGAEGEISLTLREESLTELPAAVIGTAASFWLQHQAKVFAGLTTAAYVLKQASGASYGAIAASIRQTLTALE